MNLMQASLWIHRVFMVREQIMCLCFFMFLIHDRGVCDVKKLTFLLPEILFLLSFHSLRNPSLNSVKNYMDSFLCVFFYETAFLSVLENQLAGT